MPVGCHLVAHAILGCHTATQPGHCSGAAWPLCHCGLRCGAVALPLQYRRLPILKSRVGMCACSGAARPLQQRRPAIMLFIYVPMTSHSNQACASWCLPDPPPRAFLHCKTYCAGGLINKHVMSGAEYWCLARIPECLKPYRKVLDKLYYDHVVSHTPLARSTIILIWKVN